MAVLVRINTEVAIWISRTKNFLQLPQGQMLLEMKTFSSQSWIQLLLVSAALQFWLVLNGRDLKPTSVSAFKPRG